MILPGFTDSRHFREAFPECVAYGFFPHRHQSLLQTAPLIHAADERIDVRDLAFASEFFRDLAAAHAGLRRPGPRPEDFLRRGRIRQIAHGRGILDRRCQGWLTCWNG